MFKSLVNQYHALAFATIAGLATALPAEAAAQQTLHTIHASYETQPSGPNSDFSIKLTMSPSDVDIIGFDIRVGYDNTKASLLSVTDNTGQPSAAVEYTVGGEQAFGSVAYANVSRPVVMSTLDDLINPVNLAQLNFRTTGTYNNPSNQFPVSLSAYTQSGPGGLAANLDGNWTRIPTEYDSLEPDSAVSDWNLY